MALVDTSKALGAVTDLLEQRLSTLTGHNVSIGRPEPQNGTTFSNPRFNLFLYEALFDPHLKSLPLDVGQDPPLWLVLRYLITAFDGGGLSDTIGAHRILGDGLRALRSLGHLPIDNGGAPDPALADNPEPLKVTFLEASFDLLSKLMQGAEEKYRFSMAFEVRPVMIASPLPPAYSLLIGVNYESTPPAAAAAPVGLKVEPTLGPRLQQVAPAAFQAVDPGKGSVRLIGEDLHLSGLAVELGPVVLPAATQTPDTLTFEPARSLLHGGAVSAGNHALSVFRTLPTGRVRRSNLLVASLLPELTGVDFEDRTVVSEVGDPERVTANVDLDGFLLGGPEDDVFVALYRDGATVAALDAVTLPPGPPPPAQTRIRVAIPEPGVPPAEYLVIVRVNGQQARQSLSLDLS